MARTELFSRKQPGGIYAIAGVDKHPGEIFFVHSGTGTDSVGAGRNPDSPFATIDFAVGQCTADKGDTIYVLPGHNEGLADAQIDIDVAGVSVIGLGGGGAYGQGVRPRIDFDHANASINIGANGVTIKNLTLLPSVTAVLIAIDVVTLKTDALIEDVEVLPGEDGAGVDEFADVIDIKVGCSRTKVRRLKVRQHASAAGCLTHIKLNGASDDILIEDCDLSILGAGAVACINGITTLSTNVRIKRCVLVTDAEPGIELLTGTTGSIHDTDIFTDLATIAAATVADGMAHFRVRYVEVGNESDAVVKTASIDD